MPAPLLSARNLSKRYLQKRFAVQALDDVSLEIQPGSIVALIGESGSGKSTLARCLAGLEKPDSGEIRREGTVQMVFQDPAGAMNPRFSAADVIAEPLVVQRRGTAGERRRLALELMEQVGLSPDWASRSPLQFSGGQRQRLAIARALILQPSLIILDEALSGLDLSVQAQLVDLLLELQKSRQVTYLLVSHDLALAGSIATEIAVMHQGRIVEQGPASSVFSNPRHSQTQALLAAVR